MSHVKYSLYIIFITGYKKKKGLSFQTEMFTSIQFKFNTCFIYAETTDRSIGMHFYVYILLCSSEVLTKSHCIHYRARVTGESAQ